jgi:hypothetical protein
MNRQTLLTSGLIGLTMTTTALAQNCDAIIQHGLNNVSTSYSNETTISLKYFNHCQKNLDTLDSSKMVDMEIEVFGIGRGSGGYKEEERRTALKEWCTTNRDTAMRNQTNINKAQEIYQGAVDAWSKCNALKTSDVKITPVISPDNQTVDIGIVYTGATRSGILLNGVLPDGFTCVSTRPDNKQIKLPEEIRQLTFNVACRRSSPQKEQSGGETYMRTPRGTITVQTSSNPFQLYFAEEYSPPLPASQAKKILDLLPRLEPPVGTVIASALSEDQFYSPNNPQGDRAKWILADGRPLPPATTYEKITGKKETPNLAWERDSKAVLDVVDAGVYTNTSLKSLETNAGTGGSWTWFVSLRDIQGKELNGDYEQAADHFQSYHDGDTVIAQGQTHNWKVAAWGPWQPGYANVFGISLRKRDGVFYYVKVN